MSPDEFAQLVRKVIKLRGPREAAALPAAIAFGSHVHWRIEIGKVVIESLVKPGFLQSDGRRVNVTEQVSVNVSLPEFGRSLCVFTMTGDRSYSYRDEYVDAAGELQRLIVLDALAAEA